MARTADEAERYFDEMVSFTGSVGAVGKTGTFLSRHGDFHLRVVARILVPAGKAVLARLSFEGRAYAVLYGHLNAESYYCYQRGVRVETHPVRSPGTAAILVPLAELARQGVVRYDHLAGINSFKGRFATDEQMLNELRIVKPNLRNLATATIDLVQRASAKTSRLVKKSFDRARGKG